MISKGGKKTKQLKQDHTPNAIRPNLLFLPPVNPVLLLPKQLASELFVVTLVATLTALASRGTAPFYDTEPCRWEGVI